MLERKSFMQNQTVIIQVEHFQQLIDNLIAQGYQTLAPTIKDNTVVYDEITKADEMPIGWIDEQEGGFYRLKKNSEKTFFSYTVAANSWKKYLHPPKVKLWQITKKSNQEMQFTSENKFSGKLAFIGVRSCELNAILIQDRIFLEDKFVDPIYAERRKDLFILAVNCGRAVNTCFCVSMNTGPKAEKGFDLALTEIFTEKEHKFLVEIGTEKGKNILENIPYKESNLEDKELAQNITENTIKQMGRKLDTNNLAEIISRSYENASWDEVASRCLTCANCTMVCPTCFCTSVQDTTDLTGEIAERWRNWDSCFTLDFSYIHGGSVRSSTKSRYRQWMTHKLSSWMEQFDTLGCVGCGRCISWCPVGIDITEQAKIIRQEDQRKKL